MKCANPCTSFLCVTGGMLYKVNIAYTDTGGLAGWLMGLSAYFDGDHRKYNGEMVIIIGKTAKCEYG